jgi:hypothetical protein
MFQYIHWVSRPGHDYTVQFGLPLRGGRQRIYALDDDALRRFIEGNLVLTVLHDRLVTDGLKDADVEKWLTPKQIIVGALLGSGFRVKPGENDQSKYEPKPHSAFLGEGAGS